MTTSTQQTLAGMPRAPRTPRPASASSGPVADRAPVARVCVDVQPAHLDRPFEYLVPADLDEAARPGVRVKVRFAGRDVDGWLLERRDEAEHAGTLTPLRRVVGTEPVLTPAVLELARSVADRWAGTLADVLRLALPPRHARVEAEPAPEPTAQTVPTPVGTVWAPYRGGPAFLAHLTAGGSPRAVWSALPGPAGQRWPDGLAQAVLACVLGGRAALVVVPDSADVDAVLTALDTVGLGHAGPGAPVVRLVAEDGPARRYRAFLAALRGQAQVVVGTRAAALAPIDRLGLLVCWDDDDEQHREPRAPYPHVRDVLALRAEQAGAALLLAAYGRSVAAQALVERGWAREVAAGRVQVRELTPRVRALTSVELAAEGPAAAARLPSPAWRALREGLADGPVLVQVPRTGYLPVVACARCRTPARCAACAGPLGLPAPDQPPSCGWCGRLATGWRCAACGADAVRSVRVGAARTAEELGRAFPGIAVRLSGARADEGVLRSVPSRPAVVVATPGAEPVTPDGYAAAAILDAAATPGAGALEGRETDALRRWLGVASLVRPAAKGGVVLLVGDVAPRPSQALVRWDPAGLAARELAERTELGLPPASRAATVTGSRVAVEALLARVVVGGLLVLGPVPVPAGGTTVGAGDPAGQRGRGRTRPGTLGPTGPGRAASAGPGRAVPAEGPEVTVRAVLRVPRAEGGELARALAAALALRSARREDGQLRVVLDPVELM